MKRVGFIGVGTMGTPMVANLLKAGFSVLAYDVRPEALAEARPVLSALGSTIIHVGPVGSGEVAKLCNNLHPVPGMVAKAASSRDYTAGFMTDLMAKDLGLVVMAGREQRVPLFTASAAFQLYRLASAQGLGRKDFSSVYTLLKPASDTAPV